MFLPLIAREGMGETESDEKYVQEEKTFEATVWTLQMNYS
jgi:hypothetical protein